MSLPLRSTVVASISGLVVLLALPVELAAAEDRDQIAHGAREPSSPPEGESAWARLRSDSGPAYGEAGGPAIADAPPATDAAAPRPSLAEDRLPPEGQEIDLGWWRVGLDWRRHPGVCLIDP